MPVRHLLAFAAVLALAACTSDITTTIGPSSAPSMARGGGGGSGSSGGPHFIDSAAGAPAIANPVIQFWAKKGVDTTVRMVYHAAAGRQDSVTYLAFRVRAQSLFRRPDGSAIANGDSVFITLTLVDVQHMVVDCQPSGLLFDPRHQAVAKFSYANASGDLDGNGVITPVDSLLVNALMVWRRETPTSPWIVVPSRGLPEADEVEADISGFTGYALAW